MDVPGAESVDVETHLAATVARLYYLDDESKTDIGRSLGLSRFKVARLLVMAREQGLVKIEVVDPPSALDPVASRIKELYGLRECVVVRGGDTGQDSAKHVGEAGGRLLQRVVRDGDVLGLPWSRAVHYAMGQIDSLPQIEVVQLCGSLILPGDETPYDVVRRAGALTEGSALYYQAPMIMASADGAQAVREQSDVARAFRQIPDVTVALCSIGAWAPGSSSIYDVLSIEDQAGAEQAGAVGEMMGILFGEGGTPLVTTLTERIVGITGAQVQEVPAVIAMSRGSQRAEAVRAALEGGLVTHLVVDDALTEALLP